MRESQPNHLTQNGSVGRAETGVATDGSAEGRRTVAQTDSPSSAWPYNCVCNAQSAGECGCSSLITGRHAGNVEHFADVLDDRLQDDIVTRLRRRADRCPFAESPLVLEAADEIERLRAAPFLATGGTVDHRFQIRETSDACPSSRVISDLTEITYHIEPSKQLKEKYDGDYEALAKDLVRIIIESVRRG